MELNDVIKALEELKARVHELENKIKKEVSDNLDWAKYVATDYNGEIWAYAEKPIKFIDWWRALDGNCEKITIAQAMLLCGRVPIWEDNTPTPVKR